MEVQVLNLSKSSRPGVLASVRLQISNGSESIVVDDCRVLRNRLGQAWLAMPSYSERLKSGRFDYFPAVNLSAGLKRLVEDVVIRAFEAWEAAAHVSTK